MTRWMRGLARGAEQRLDAEVQFHLDARVADLVAAGMSPDVARSQATREFGGVDRVKEACRDQRMSRWLTDTLRDLRVAGRTMLRAPVFATVAVLTLTLGIGVNVAMFQIYEALIMRALPVPDPESLMGIRVVAGDGGRSGNFRGRLSDLTWNQVEVLRRELPDLDGLAVWTNMRLNLADSGEVQMAQGLRVSGDYFRVLGVSPLRGRLLGPSDDIAGCAPGAAVVGERFWRQTLGARADVVGQPLRLDGYTFQIAGVAPAAFTGVEVGRRTDVFLPLCTERVMADGSATIMDMGHGWWLAAVARVPDGTSAAQLAARLGALSPGIFRETLPTEYRPELADRYLQFRLTTEPAGAGVSPLRTRYQSPLSFLFALGGFVLLITCANLANLLLARGMQRERELAVRQAVGASRARLIRTASADAVLLTAVGLAGGVALAFVLSRMLVAALGSGTSPVHLEMPMNWTLVAFAAALAAASAALAAAAPALRAARTAPISALRDGLRSTASGATITWRRVLVAGQVALTCVLIVGALLFARSLANLRAIDVGFDPEGLVAAEVNLSRLPDWEARRAAVVEGFRERLDAAAWVDSFSEVAFLPLGGNEWNDAVEVSGLSQGIQSQLNQVGLGYFETLGIPLVEGRSFDATDTPATPNVAVVNQAFADQLASGTSPIGQHVRFLYAPDVTYEVVGVVGNAKYGSIREANPPTVFVAWHQDPKPSPYVEIVVRSTLPPDAARHALVQTLQSGAPPLPFQSSSLEALVDDGMRLDRLLATLAVGFGALALLLAGIGLYGVIAYIAARREHEIGIRLALGASRGGIVRQVVQEMAGVVATGAVVGLGAAWVLSRTLEGMLYELAPHDVPTYVVSLLVLLTVGLLASALPAWRAARISPMRALRES